MDYVSTTVLKSAADVFEHQIANLANPSFAEGTFPSSFKIGQVTPLLKKPGASMENMSNYESQHYRQDSRKTSYGADETPHGELAKPRPIAIGILSIAFHRDGNSGERFAVCDS